MRVHRTETITTPLSHTENWTHQKANINEKEFFVRERLMRTESEADIIRYATKRAIFAFAIGLSLPSLIRCLTRSTLSERTRKE
uniref:Uncharacterized protein n=1 Tax=Caenorhabditis tropicalis TaxID=1561998 RepID=A0A1I7U0I9_9PELO